MVENIYRKILNVQKNLEKRTFKKTGHNSYSNFDYFELEDILPGIIEECVKEDLLLSFSFSHDSAVLKIRDAKEGTLIESNRVEVPQLKELNKGMNIVQSYGAYITYLKRYLLLNTFLICEESYIDSDSAVLQKPRKKSQSSQIDDEKQNVMNSVRKNLKTPAEYVLFFEAELIQENYDLTKQNMFKKCTEQRKVNPEFKSFEKDTRRLIREKYGG